MELIRRWCIILIGGAVVAVGLVLMPLPGPGGLPVTFAGLAILAAEVPWARLFLRRLKQRLRLASWPGTSRAGRFRALALIAALIVFWILGGIVVWRVWAF